MLSRTKRIFGMGVGCLFVIAAIGISSSASAVTAMYSQGTLNVEAFANDTTTGPSYPYTTQVFLGIPLGTFCNQFKGGGVSPCGGFNTKGQNGLPLAGMDFHALPTTAAPVPFALNEGRIRQKLGTPATSFTYGPNGTKRPANGVPGGSFSYYFPYIYSYSYADLKNAAGNFFAGGGGPGNWSFTKTEGGYNAGSVKVTAGANKFGGTMNLLGYYFTNNGYQRSVGLSVAISSTWKFQAVAAARPAPSPRTYTRAAPTTRSIPASARRTPDSLSRRPSPGRPAPRQSPRPGARSSASSNGPATTTGTRAVRATSSW